jgi:hypothetical protein
VLAAATIRLFSSDRTSAASCQIAEYHRSVKPSQRMFKRDELNEYAIRMKIGA